MIDPWGSPLAGPIGRCRRRSDLLLLGGEGRQLRLSEKRLLLQRPCRRREGRQGWAGTRPHLNGPYPRVVEGGPARAPAARRGTGLLLLGAGGLLACASCAASATCAAAVATAVVLVAAVGGLGAGLGGEAPLEFGAGCCWEAGAADLTEAVRAAAGED